MLFRSLCTVSVRHLPLLLACPMQKCNLAVMYSTVHSALLGGHISRQSILSGKGTVSCTASNVSLWICARCLTGAGPRRPLLAFQAQEEAQDSGAAAAAIPTPLSSPQATLPIPSPATPTRRSLTSAPHHPSTEAQHQLVPPPHWCCILNIAVQCLMAPLRHPGLRRLEP